VYRDGESAGNLHIEPPVNVDTGIVSQQPRAVQTGKCVVLGDFMGKNSVITTGRRCVRFLSVQQYMNPASEGGQVVNKAIFLDVDGVLNNAYRDMIKANPKWKHVGTYRTRRGGMRL
jgi:hypothetical protein